MRDVVTYTDYFVICSGRNARQTQAIAEGMRETLKRDRIVPSGVDGERQGDWILLDYLDVVVHVSRSADGRRRVASVAGRDRAAGTLCELDGQLLEELVGARCLS